MAVSLNPLRRNSGYDAATDLYVQRYRVGQEMQDEIPRSSNSSIVHDRTSFSNPTAQLDDVNHASPTCWFPSTDSNVNVRTFEGVRRPNDTRRSQDGHGASHDERLRSLVPHGGLHLSLAGSV